MVKRKAEGASVPQSPPKKGRPSENAPAEYKPSFREGLFDKAVESLHRSEYTSSSPYKHAVIHELVDDALLRSVRQEILKNLHFTPKETDIYRIHQSGDLANLDGLPRSALKLLPSLRQLRDSLYSKLFRDFIRGVTGCGPLSGKKTDMAINVYTPGSHLLTHDDVIGSRRVSYILYLTSPDQPWQASWGGALRLYPTKVAKDGVTRVPEPQWSKVIPPAWNQLSFFEVQPGKSFHDVEEVYAEEEGEEQRVRMAISGWFHIPQEGEDGYIEGLEEKLAQQSSLQQLKSKSDAFDLPKKLSLPDNPDSEDEEDDEEGDESPLSEKDLDFLLKFISPTYLTPDTLENMAEAFAEDSSVQITNFLSKAFAKKLKEYIRPRDGKEYSLENSEGWEVAVPPHKHRFLYLQQPPTTSKKAVGDMEELNPVEQLLTILLPSKPFSKLLQLATGLKLTTSGCDLLARRFRRGLDYTLATGSSGDADDDNEDDEEGEDQAGSDLKLEVCLGITPSKGWGGEDDDEDDDEEHGQNGKSKGKGKAKIPKITPFDDSEKTVGGYEIYMNGDSDSDSSDDEEEEGDPNHSFKSSNGTKKKSDPAIYKAARGNEGEDILFTMPASWNRLSIVLRDSGLLRFVKYVSKSAAGDRWDVVGNWAIVTDDDDVADGNAWMEALMMMEEDEDEDEGDDADEDEREDGSDEGESAGDLVK